MGLALEDLLLNSSGCDEAVHEAVLLLSISPHSSKRLLVSRWIPVGVEKNQTVRANKIQPTAAGFGRQEKNKFLAFRIVEFVDELLALADVHSPVEAERAVSAGAAQPLEDIERLRVIGDQDDFVVGVGADACQHAVEDLHFAGVPGLDFAVAAATSVFGDVVVGEEGLAAGEVVGKVEEVGVVAELFEEADSFEGL